MFGIGMPELIVILMVALIFIGPKKLPDLAKALAKGLAEFRRATEDVKENFNMGGELTGIKEDLTTNYEEIVMDIKGKKDLEEGNDGEAFPEMKTENKEKEKEGEETGGGRKLSE